MSQRDCEQLIAIGVGCLLTLIAIAFSLGIIS
jgi:hypothetical protein